MAVATAVLAVLLPLLLTVLQPAVALAPGPTSRAQAEPLRVHLDAISPTLPRKGTLEISGTVTNTTPSDYTRVNLLAFSSAAPITNSQTLAASAAVPPEEYVGERVTVPGTFATIDLLPAGGSATFSVSVPVELLYATGEPGVYWVGIHAFGDGPEPRDIVADGRARTFIPALPRDEASMEAAVILPLRGRVWYEPDGTLGGTDRWLRWLSDGGRLDTALDIADAAGSNTYTWLVDPAILMAVTRLQHGNPPRSLAPDPAVPDQQPTEPTPEGEESGGEPAAPTPNPLLPPVESPTEEEQAQDQDEEQSGAEAAAEAEAAELASAAEAWLARFTAASAARPVLALPYGDLDVSAAVRNRPERFEQARARTEVVMNHLGIPFQHALAPENDVLSSEALLATPAPTPTTPGTTILMGDTVAFASPPMTANSTVRLLGHKVVVTSTGAQSGGPAPTRAHDPLAMRQRLLSEAALRVLDGSTAPIVVTLPSGWSPEDAGALFSAFDERWLSSVAVADVAGRQAVGVPGSALAYTEEDMAGELGAANFLAADRLSQAAALLEEVLAAETTVQQQVDDELLVTLSQQHRDRARPAQRSAGAMREHIVDQLGAIRIEANRKVTLSSDSGRIGATLVNGLDQPVVVRVDATSDGEMTFAVVGDELRRLAPGSRTRVNFKASAERAGVHNVRFSVRSGTTNSALGSSARLPVRAAQVSGLIWVVMAAGAALLLSAAGLRLWRQVRRRTDSTDAPQVPATTDPAAGRRQEAPA